MSQPPPLIAVCARVLTFSDEGKRDAFSSSQPYSRAVARAGGVPVLVPPIHELTDNALTVLQHFDGVLLPGGGDIDPRCYGQEPTEESLYGIVAANDELDMAVAGCGARARPADAGVVPRHAGPQHRARRHASCKTSATTSTGCASTR